MEVISTFPVEETAFIVIVFTSSETVTFVPALIDLKFKIVPILFLKTSASAPILAPVLASPPPGDPIPK